MGVVKSVDLKAIFPPAPFPKSTLNTELREKASAKAGSQQVVMFQARTALVEWRCTLQDNPQEASSSISRLSHVTKNNLRSSFDAAPHTVCLCLCFACFLRWMSLRSAYSSWRHTRWLMSAWRTWSSSRLISSLRPVVFLWLRL